MDRPDVFLSYSREDTDRASLFAQALAQEGYSVWWDRHLRSGDTYDQVTENALREARSVVVLWSNRSVKSRWVRAEATQADRLGTLKPAMIEQCDRPIMFELVQTADLSRWNGDRSDPEWRAYLAALKRDDSVAPVKTQSAPVTKRAVAVLPFDDLTHAEDMAYFALGISEEIISCLTRGCDLPIIGKLSSFRFRGVEKANAPGQLQASHLVDGSVRVANERVRITAHLIDATNDQMIWSDNYEAPVTDVIDIQTDIARSIADALNAQFQPVARHKVAPETYDAYLQARALISTHYDFAGAVKRLQEVVCKDPLFVDGWGALAFAATGLRVQLSRSEWPRITAIAEEAIERAKNLDPGNIEAAASEVSLLRPYGDFERQNELIGVLRKSAADHPTTWFWDAWHLMSTGQLSASVVSARRGRDLGPDHELAYWYGLALYYDGQLRAALPVMRRDLAQVPGNTGLAMTILSCAAILGDEEAIAEILGRDHSSDAAAGAFGNVVEAVRLEIDGTDAQKAEFLAAVSERVRREGRIDLLTAVYVARFGGAAACHDLIEASELGSALSTEEAPDFIAMSPMLVFLVAWPEIRLDPRFADLCARLGLARFWLENDVWPDCAREGNLTYNFRQEIERAASAISAD